jgi:molybdopterin-guanine dinucleotide biosynthesis protein A
VNNNNDLRHLPVFQLSGKTKALRHEFTAELLAELARRSLSGIFLSKSDNRILTRYALISEIKLHDLVIIDAGLDFPVQQIHLGTHPYGDGKSLPGSLVWAGGDGRAMQDFIDQLTKKLDQLVQQTPVWGCILIGGKSSRMGRPKHLIEDEKNITWLERTINVLRPLVDGLVVSGAGLLPEKLQDLVRLADIPGVVGPLTGVLAACRWQPTVSWMFVACDMPHITSEAIQWLLSSRRAGCWGRVPRLEGSKHCEPLLACYDFRAGPLFEEQFYNGNLRIGAAATHPKIENPVIPAVLHSGWQNINTPDELQTAPR